MSLNAGTRIGVYEVVAPLGAGGMGEVYRATDTRLGRAVALKTLPPEFALDPDRRARFEREARTLATLNHPHIAQIYGLEDVPGVYGAPSLLALAMELVDGEDLAQRIARGPVPLDEALPLARQVAEGLEAAHEAGIVHRDLKPANIRVTPEGVVKVLDFGLAKPSEPAASSVMATHSPTLTSPALTTRGVVLGTAAYMAPEQAKGKPVDRRADIWAFGCVLYELLTGRRAFEGEDVPEILGAIIKTEPDWTRLPASTPRHIRTLLLRCLAKDKTLRLQHIGDARLELAAPGTDGASTAPLSGLSSSSARAVWLAAGAAAGAIVMLLAAYPAPAPPDPTREVHLDLATPSTTDPIAFAISPDAEAVAFVATDGGQPRLWVRRLAEDRARVLAGTDGASFVFWSPDSRSVGFFSDGRVKRIDADGGSLQVITATSALGTGASWGRDGTILFAPAAIGARILRAPVTGGAATPVTTLAQGQHSHRFPVWLPDGHHFLFFAAGAASVRGVYLANANGDAPVRLLDADGAAAFDAATTRLLYVRQRTLYTQGIDLATASLVGEPVRIADGIAVRDAYSATALSVAGDGTIVYRAGSPGGSRQYVWVDEDGQEIKRLGQPDDLAPLNPALSPDGRRVAFSRIESGATDLWSLDTERGLLERLTSGEGVDSFPVWSRTGNHLVFRRAQPGLVADLAAGAIVEAPVPGTRAEAIRKVASLGSPQDVSSDARFMLTRRGVADAADLWAEPLGSPGEAIAVATSAFSEYNGVFSPDGRWVAYQTTESGRSEIVVQRFPEPVDRTRVSTEGGGQPQWRPDGRALYYIGFDGRLVRAAFDAGAHGPPRIGAAEPRFMTRIGGALQGFFRAQYAVSPDGRRFLMNTLVEEPGLAPLSVLMRAAR